MVALDHQAARSVPNHVVVHGPVAALANLADGGVKAHTVLDDVVNPIVGHLSPGRFALHDLHDGTVGLEVTNVPHFVVEDLGCVTDGQHGGSTREVNGVVGEVHVSAALVDGGHQAFLVGGRPVDGVEIGIVHRVVVRLTRRALEFNGAAVRVGDGNVVNKTVGAAVKPGHPAVVL